MVSPRRVLWTLAAVVGLTTIPSFFAYWTQTLWVAKLMFWIYIPAIYFFIGPCMALVLNLAPSNMRSIFTAWSVLVGNVFNLIRRPAGRRHHERLLCRRPRGRCRLIASGATVSCADRTLGGLAFLVGRKNRGRGPDQGRRLRNGMRGDLR